ncbi:hypothetical protein B0H34DRAFT_657924, partial [Crassisporium funariophilum]
HDESTSNLVHHIQHCSPSDLKESCMIAAYTQGSQYTESKHRMKITLWVACRNCPFSIVEDPELLNIFLHLNAHCVTPGRRTVSRNIKEIFLLSRKNVGAILQASIQFIANIFAYPGKIHICAGGWTSPNVISFIGATAHWIIDGKMVTVILDYIK